MGRLRQRVRHPALPGAPRAKAGAAAACGARDAKARERRAKNGAARGKTTPRKPE